MRWGCRLRVPHAFCVRLTPPRVQGRANFEESALAWFLLEKLD
jgi:hypothetical protein